MRAIANIKEVILNSLEKEIIDMERGLDEITKKFEEQHAALEAKIAEEKANLEVKLAEAAEASAKKFGDEKAALEGKIAELEAKRDELEARCVHSASCVQRY